MQNKTSPFLGCFFRTVKFLPLSGHEIQIAFLHNLVLISKNRSFIRMNTTTLNIHDTNGTCQLAFLTPGKLRGKYRRQQGEFGVKTQDTILYFTIL